MAVQFDILLWESDGKTDDDSTSPNKSSARVKCAVLSDIIRFKTCLN